MKHLTLFQLTAEITDIVDDIIDAAIAGDISQQHALYDELAALYDARSEKHEGYVHVIKNAEAAAEACQAEADRFLARARALVNLAKYLKETLWLDLYQHGEKRTEAGNFKIARQNGQKRVVVRIPAEELPADYQRITIQADKNALKDALKDGTEIDGVQLESTEHIRIRLK